jgi:hypothetical protein
MKTFLWEALLGAPGKDKVDGEITVSDFVRIGMWFGNLSKPEVAQRAADLAASNWFHRYISAEEAVRRLEKGQKGNKPAFLVRFGIGNPGVNPYVIHIIDSEHKSAFLHISYEDLSVPLFVIKGINANPFPDLVAFIKRQFLTKNEWDAVDREPTDTKTYTEWNELHTKFIGATS